MKQQELNLNGFNLTVSINQEPVNLQAIINLGGTFKEYHYPKPTVFPTKAEQELHFKKWLESQRNDVWILIKRHKKTGTVCINPTDYTMYDVIGCINIPAEKLGKKNTRKDRLKLKHILETIINDDFIPSINRPKYHLAIYYKNKTIYERHNVKTLPKVYSLLEDIKPTLLNQLKAGKYE